MSNQSITLNVSGMTCMGCVGTVRRLLTQIAGVQSVDIDLASGRVHIDYDPATVQLGTLRQSIADGGYEVVD